MAKYRKKPVVIDAEQWDGSANARCAILIMGGNRAFVENYDGTLSIETLEGTMRASLGDWIIKGIKGEFYPCKPDIFVGLYDLVPDLETGT